tara:strand:+ start:53 stop:880 length:828 start_codon:yes stop_codon:yes gene_type:complete
MSRNIGWKDNTWQNIDSISISIKDRGLKFGDGLFETILIKNNQPILLKEHLKRFERNLNLLNYKIKIDYQFFTRIINEGIKKLDLNNEEYGSIRINYSRGINVERSIKIDGLGEKFDHQNLWIEFYLIKVNFNKISVHISETEKRNEYSLLSQCKTFNYTQSIQALIEANKKNFDDSILLNTRNELCCGTTFNILLKRDHRWLTPRKESGCLQGIMVSKLLDLNFVKEAFLIPNFNKYDLLIAINSLSCRQIKSVNDFEFDSDFDTQYFWNFLYK